MKQSFIIIIIAIAAVVFYALWSSGKLPGMISESEPLPTLTTTDNTGDIEQDLNNLTVTAEDEGFTEIQSDLGGL
ncbi:hypothetical protein A3A79_04105 [Candidatus Gottesmanbacteria bacterium RIFCSPLOWO2_01_FULL_43_11b]|uniref:Uncharacterized protein n=1 Tax=Candidatus Gottesmanbacteria bacterium RIFCSPLOWO2_01_FULL_43_11b TaxID=1798392 RepID=A0A1F6AHW6_9BACT|nr:MAG: hypothetical protein A3A79_04105 [Candidatus Gottesmanbacteria bacterium RIFCSPLOWO2_01_FULL_43_11b]